MPGPRGKQNGAKKGKSKLQTSAPASPRTMEFAPLVEAIDSAEDWNTVANLLCNYLELPGAILRS